MNYYIDITEKMKQNSVYHSVYVVTEKGVTELDKELGKPYGVMEAGKPDFYMLWTPRTKNIQDGGDMMPFPKKLMEKCIEENIFNQVK